MVARPDYGLDAPVVLRRLVVFGPLAIAAGLVAPRLAGAARPFADVLLGLGGWSVFCAGVMLWGSRVGKFWIRDTLLDGIRWRGDERVLDVGCGHGLLLIGAAKRLTSGRAVGVDLWRTYDQAGNDPRATLENARLEGVADRVQIETADACRLPFADASFVVVLSSFALHNIPARDGRASAVREALRVLKPGGRLAFADIWSIREYRRVLRAAGLATRLSWPRFYFVVPTFVLTAEKPGQGAGG